MSYQWATCSIRFALLGRGQQLRPEQEEQSHQRAVADAKAALGDDAFAAAWARGEAMTPDEIVAFAQAG